MDPDFRQDDGNGMVTHICFDGAKSSLDLWFFHSRCICLRYENAPKCEYALSHSQIVSWSRLYILALQRLRAEELP